MVDLRNSVPERRVIDRRLKYGRGPLLENELPAIEASLEFVKRPRDCPCPISGLHVVSDRVRHILEMAAPGNCQFVPIKLWHNDEPCSFVYWVLYVDAIDCADHAKSRRTRSGLIIDIVLDEARVPLETRIFRVWDPVDEFSHSSIFVRDGIRRALESEKITGNCFYKPPDPLPPLYPRSVQ